MSLFREDELVLDIDAVEPIHPAVHLTRHQLFNPFDARKWIVLACLVFVVQFSRNIASVAYDFMNLLSNLTSLAGLGANRGMSGILGTAGTAGFFVTLALLFVIIVGASILGLWMRSQAEFVFIDSLARHHSRTEKPFREYYALGNSLFRLRALVLAVPIAAITLCLLFVLASGVFDSGDFAVFRNPAMAIAASIALVLFISAGVFNFFAANFVLPIMYAQHAIAPVAIREAWNIVRSEKSICFYYAASRFLLWTVGYAIYIIINCFTCCLCINLPLVPDFLNLLLTLPFWVALMAYSIYFIEQFGPEYQIIQPDLAYSGVPNLSATAEQHRAQGVYAPMPPDLPDGPWRESSANTPPTAPPPPVAQPPAPPLPDIADTNDDENLPPPPPPPWQPGR